MNGDFFEIMVVKLRPVTLFQPTMIESLLS